MNLVAQLTRKASKGQAFHTKRRKRTCHRCSGLFLSRGGIGLTTRFLAGRAGIRASRFIIPVILIMGFRLFPAKGFPASNLVVPIRDFLRFPRRGFRKVGRTFPRMNCRCRSRRRSIKTI